MIQKQLLSFLLVIAILCPGYPDTERPALPPSPADDIMVYPGNHGFLHAVGAHVPYGWTARFRLDRPGYFIKGRLSQGESLDEGIYQYVFYFIPEPGQLGGLFKAADDVVRIEAWDTTTRECVMSRTFQCADFVSYTHLTPKALIFSTHHRLHHRFEPRVYWPGQSSVFLNQVVLQRLEPVSLQGLERKTALFEQMMGTSYIKRGYVLGQDSHGQPQDYGDAAIWTGLYAATEAWRYQATGSLEAKARMHASLEALHALAQHAPRPGTLVRYVDEEGHAWPDPASKDSYAGFFFGVANALPVEDDPILQSQLRQDVRRIADSLLDHDLTFISANGHVLDLNPYFSEALVAEALEDLKHHPHQRHDLIRILNAIRIYFFSHGQRPWPELVGMIRALKKGDIRAMHGALLPALNGGIRALSKLESNVAHSSHARLDQGPYAQLDTWLKRALHQLSPPSPQADFQRVQDVKVLPAQALQALHILKVAAEVLPKPNRYEVYYRANLWQNKALLKTVADWDNMDEDLMACIFGHTKAAIMRPGSAHLSYLALYDLIRLEHDSVAQRAYQQVFEGQFASMQDEYNAMAQTMDSIVGNHPDQMGLVEWSLMLYPEDRRGKGEAYWRRHHRSLARRYGGDVLGKARDPLPVNERPRDPFLWQRSSRSLRGDSNDRLYPPLDYLFVYWLARSQSKIK